MSMEFVLKALRGVAHPTDEMPQEIKDAISRDIAECEGFDD